MVEQIIYEIPLFVFIVLGIYAIYQLKIAKAHLGKGPIADSYGWLIWATGFFLLWAVDHIMHDLVNFEPSLGHFLHYYVSHMFVVIGMVFIVIAAKKTLQFAYTWHEKGED
ncbi:MAG: hypothetical protein AABX88_01425 [Nanoarchaeota archaeon]